MPNTWPRPAARRRGGARRRRSRSRAGEPRADESLNLSERQLLASYCAPGSALLALGTGVCREARAAARLGYRVTAVAVAPSGSGAEQRTHAGLGIEWLESDGLTLPVGSRAFDAAFVPLPLLDRMPARVSRIALLREAARAVHGGGHVIVSVRNALAGPGWRRSLWSYVERRAGEGPAWRRLDPSGLELGSPAATPARSPGALLREAASAGLRIRAELPWPAPPPGALGTLARRGAACWHAAFEVA